MHPKTGRFIACCALAAAAFAGERDVAPKGSGIIRNAARPAETTQSATIDLIVRFRDRATPRRLDEFRGDLARLRGNRVSAQAVGIRDVYRIVLSGARVRVGRELRNAIATLPYVKTVDDDRKVVAMGSGGRAGGTQSGGRAAALQKGHGVRVAVIDTGIDYTHPALGGGFGEGYKVAGGWDFVEGDGDPMDENGHGTHVAGIIAAESEQVTGVAPDVTLLAYRVLGAQGQGDLGDAISAIERAVDPDQNGDPSDHVDVINLSLGARYFADDDPAVIAVENATALGVVVSIAAGNSGDFGRLPTPAVSPSAITVAAANGDKIASFSSRGPSYSYGIKPDVAAPGVNVTSTLPGNKFGELSGTSMAAPYVAGIAALLKEAHPDWTPAAIKSAIVNSANAIDAEVLAAGAGRADATSASGATLIAEPVAISFGQNNDMQAVWTSSKTLTLRNASAEAQTLTANVIGQRDGIVVHVDPPTLTIAAGESATVTVGIAVTNAKVPAPIDPGSLAFDGAIEWSGSTSRITMPWAFEKGTFLRVTVPNAVREWVFEVFGNKWQYGSEDSFYDGRIYWMLETVDLLVWEFSSLSEGKPDRVVFSEQVDTRATSDVTFDLDQATLEIKADTTDANGGALHNSTRSCSELMVFQFPSGRRKTFEQFDGVRMWFGPVSDRVKIYVRDSCADLAQPAVYAAIHPPFFGLHEDVTTTLRPQWLHEELVFDPGRESHLTEVLPAVWFDDGGDALYFTGGAYFLMRPTPARLTAYYTQSPEANVELHEVVGRWGHCPTEELPNLDCVLLGDLHLRLGGNEITVENDYYTHVTPMAYHLTPGSTLTVGGGPIWPRFGFGWGPGAWTAGGWWFGGLGEQRHYSSTLHTVLRDAAGNVIGEGGESMYKPDSIPYAAYRIESTNSGARVFGGPAVAHGFVTLDLNDEEDKFWPSITGLRILDHEQRVTDWIDHGASASLLLSAVDLVNVDGRLTGVRPNEAATRVDYRVHGTGEWHPLTALLADRYYHQSPWAVMPVGSVFRVDLSSVARDSFGPIDLRVHVEDDGAHTNEFELVPAFYVRDPGRKRSVGK